MATSAAPPAPEAFTASRRYTNYVLGVLFVVYVFNFIDRQIINILLEPIKEDLGASDTQMGFLTGIAFALFYTVAGIPIARYADTGVRRSVIAVGLAVWSGMTALSGLTRAFWQMALARVGVGVGEAACSPPAHSLIADYFPPERRSTALAIYAMGIHFGVLFGFLAGGWLNEFFGWRMAFFVVGLPGIALAVLLRLTVREPPRGHSEGAAARADEATPELRDVLAFLRRVPAFWHLALGAAFHSFAGYGAGAWSPAFLIRVHGMGTGEIGTWLGLITGIAGATGAFTGGMLADRLAVRDQRWTMRVAAFSSLLPVPFFTLFMFLADPIWALIALIPSTFIGAMWLGPGFSTVQGLVKLRMRALAAAVLLFVINLIGLGLGPQTVGLLNDTLFAHHGDEAVRHSLFWVVALMDIWGAIHFWLAARTLRRDLRVRDE